MRRRACVLLLLTGSLFVALGFEVSAQDVQQVEVVQVEGLIDRSVDRTVRSVIEEAEQAEASMIVLQIDSPGVVGSGRAERLRRVIRSSAVPIVTWVGPANARAAHGAVVILGAGIPAAAPGAIIGPLETIDFRERLDLDRLPESVSRLPRDIFDGPVRITSGGDLSSLSVVAPSIEELLSEVESAVDTDDARIRFHNLDLFGRLLHAAAKPSITYLLVLAGLVGIVFELFHPSTGPAGVSGVAALALGLFGIVTLGGSWLGFALIVAGVAGFAVDLRYQGLGPFTAAGFAALVAGSLLLFRGPWLHVSPWVLAFGITSMVLFLVGAMTRVLRDLRAVARGELEVRDAHPNGHGG